MGATIVFLLMIGLFFLAFAGVVAGIFLLVTKQKKSIAIGAIAVGCIIALLPLGFLMFLRYQNGQPEDDYVDTGVTIKWNSDYNAFTYEGDDYVRLYDYYEDDGFYYGTELDGENLDIEDMEPAFNIESKWDFWGFVFNFNDASTMYRVESGSGKTMYWDYEFYCREDEREQLKQYYNENVEWSVTDYTDDREDFYYPLELTVEDVEAVYSLDEGKKTSLKESKIEKFCEIRKVSTDGLVSGYTDIVFDGECWYWDSDDVDEEKSTDDNYVYIVYELPESLSEKIENALK